MVQQFKVPETESELRQLQDKLYSITKEQTETGAFRGFRGLLEIMASETVIMTAIHNIKANKGAETAGTDGRTMRADILQQDYTQIVAKVQRSFQNYRPMSVRRKWIPKPGKSEKRPLGIPAIMNRIIQECVRIVLEPIMEAQFFKHSYGFRPWRDAHMALERVKDQVSRVGYYWIVEGDISKFFDNVNHTILIKKLWHMGVRDQRVLMIIKAMLKAGIMGEISENPLGTPQGGLCQAWHNPPYAKKEIMQSHIPPTVHNLCKSLKIHPNSLESLCIISETVSTDFVRIYRKSEIILMNQPLPELLNSLESELLRLGYTEGTMTFYRNRWKKLLDFAKKRDEKYFTEDLGMAFAEEILNIPLTSGKLTQRETQDLRVVRMIGDFALHHSILRRYYKHKELLHTPEFLSCRDRFADYCEQKMYSNVTTEHYLKQASYLLDYLESQNITACTDITIQNIHAYLNTLGGYTYKTIEQRVCGIRAFLRFLNESGIYTNNLAEQTPMMQARKHTRIPSVWTEAELKQLLSVIDRGNPKGKRDYAIILFACFLGLRVSDIKKLTFSCFDWREKRLTFVQSKTHQPVVLPIPDEVGWAVIDYLKNGRPAVDTDIVFVRHIAPFLPFSEADHLHQLIRDYMRLAHLPTLKKHRGMHSLRHTAASRMLESGVPLETISQILGHEDPDSTDVYLKTDVERLRECCEELEEVCR